tara:strand:- start:3382 stop:3720 length:339 start_codon:yes stop_codon:yes gene_type:complete
MKSKINCFNCKISIGDNELHNKDYLSLYDIADELKLSYSIIADISCGRRNKKKWNEFIYYPIIEITKLKHTEKAEKELLLEEIEKLKKELLIKDSKKDEKIEIKDEEIEIKD